jgi:opacity protein-like surface antigen
MKNCKNVLLVGGLGLFLFNASSTAFGAARSNEGIDYLLRNPSLSRFSAGIYGGSVDRKVELGGNRWQYSLQSSRLYGYFGYDVTKWANVYAIMGGNQAKLSGRPKTDDQEWLYGAGLSANLLSHFFSEPTPMEDVFRINGDIRVISTKANLFPSAVSWQEITASLRFSLVNFPRGSKDYRPEAIALYAGPAFSYIQSSAFKAKQELGVVAGMEVFFVDTMSLDLSFEYYDSTSIFAGLNVRF